MMAMNNNWQAIWAQTFIPNLMGQLHPAKSGLKFSIAVPANGDALRLKLCNTLGKEPHNIEALAVKHKGKEVLLTVAQRLQFSIPAGEERYTDEIGLPLEAGSTLEIAFCTADKGMQGNMIEPEALWYEGIQTAAELFAADSSKAAANRPGMYAFIPTLAEIQIRPDYPVPTIIAFGDSFVQQNLWTKPLASILSENVTSPVILLNKGIAGNRLLTGGEGWQEIFGEAGLDRFENDVFSHNNVAAAIICVATNDIGMSDDDSATAVLSYRLIEAFKQITNMLHARNVKAIAATIPPRMNSEGFTAQKEHERLALNEWLRNSGCFDAIVDFDLCLRDKDNPACLDKCFDSGDGLHPNARAGEVMAAQFDFVALLGEEIT